VPLPSQNPVVPQLAAPVFVHEAVGSPPPAGTGVHVPALPGTAQERQVVAQAVLQQTPWAQIPDMHSPPPAHAAANPFSPHEPLLQTAVGAQSALAVQVFLQTPVPQPNGKHEVAPGVTQAPAPLQVAPGVNVVFTHVESLQGVPCA
jgi:hypothetical protein